MALRDFVPRIISKMFSPAVETKSNLSFWPSDQSFPEFLLLGGNADLSAFAAILLYKDVMPFSNAVDIRADGFSTIPPKLWDKSKKEFLDGGDPLELLAKPNADVSQIEFLEQCSSFYDITGNTFILATGRVDFPPIELAVVPPQSTGFGPTSRKFGILHVPDAISVATTGGGRERFIAEDDRVLGLRFINKDRDKELWHVRTFNPLRSSNNFRGMSKARSIWLEMQQYSEGNKNNLSMLLRGMRPSGAWVNNRGEELTDTQWARLQEEAQKYSGSQNAGGTPILDGMDFKEFKLTNRDMQFKDLQEAMVTRISTKYRIPLPLLLSQSMTFNNLETSALQLFDGAIAPLATKFYSEFTRFLLPRYKGMEDIEFRYNENDIPALRLRKIETAKAQSEIQVNTVNEIRATIGYEGLEEGGDDVLVGIDKIPLGSDQFTDDNLTRPGSASKFIEKLTELKDKDGKQKYSDAEIKQMADQYYPGETK